MVRERADERHVVLVERLPASREDRQDPDSPLLEQQRGHEQGAVTKARDHAIRGWRMGERPIGHVVAGHHQPPLRHRAGDETGAVVDLARARPEPDVPAAGAGLVRVLELPRFRVQHAHDRAAGTDQASCLLDRVLQDGWDVGCRSTTPDDRLVAPRGIAPGPRFGLALHGGGHCRMRIRPPPSLTVGQTAVPGMDG